MKTEISDAAAYIEIKRQALESGKINIDDFAAILRVVPFSYDDMDYFDDKYRRLWKKWHEEERNKTKEVKK